MENIIITTLHPDNDQDTNLYPNIIKDNIPNNAIDKSKLENGTVDMSKLDDDVKSLLDSAGELHPSGVDTSTHILAFTSDTGIWIGSDTGYWYYWNGTQYVSGGVYQATEVAPNSIVKNMLEGSLRTIVYNSILVNAGNYETVLPDLDGISNNQTYILLFATGSTNFPAHSPYSSTWGGFLGTVETFLEETQTYGIQIYTEFETKIQWIRFKASSWYSWSRIDSDLVTSINNINNNLSERNTLLIRDSNYLTELSDFNSANKNTKYLCLFATNSTSIPAHTPYGSSWQATIGVLITFEDGDYGLQIFIDDEGGYYYRIKAVSWLAWKNGKEHKIINISPLDNVIAKLKTVSDGDTVVFSHGNYNIIEIYKSYYGNDFWDNYTGYDGQSDEFYQGLPCKRGTKWICSPNAKFTCIYEGNNPNVAYYFSPINTGDGYSIIGLNLHSSGCRYAIHDDFNTSATPRICEMRNCKIIDDTSRAIGGGFGISNNYILDGNYFKGYTYSITYHNNAVTVRNQMTITNNYFDGKVSFRNYGESTEKSLIIFSGNSQSVQYELIQEVPSQPADNIEVFAWNNIIRS